MMKICFICTEIFAFGKYGGFGRATRIIGRELVKRGIEVCAVVPRRTGQGPQEILDGITVYSYPALDILECKKRIRQTGADIFHSEQPSFGTYLAMSAEPHKVHLVTSRDPKNHFDWALELKTPSVNWLRSAAAYFYENNFLVRKAVQKADGVFYCAKYLEPKVRQLYSVNGKLDFLPTPVTVTRENFQKAGKPTVCFLARWDKRKRPERFFEIAKKFPEVTFIAPGKSQNYEWDRHLRDTYGKLPNVEMPGFVDQFSGNQLWEILRKSWILINTATREGLPTSFLEALAHRCALLSQANPEEVTERFGYHVKEDEFEEGLSRLLEKNAWKLKGEAGQRYVSENYELHQAIDRHLSVYEKFLSERRR